MATTPNGRFYPDADKRIPNRKAQRRLDARIKAWESLPSAIKGKQYGNTKPGSNSKLKADTPRHHRMERNALEAYTLQYVDAGDSLERQTIWASM